MCCRFFDLNDDVMYWSSEETVIQYKCPTDGNLHDYYIDFTVKFVNGKILLIEVKPEAQTILPKKSSGKSKKTYLSEALAFEKNKAKWLYADMYAKEHNAKFVIWTENQLKRLGMPIL